MLEWAKYYLISCDNISFFTEIYGCQVSAQQDGIRVGGSSRWEWRWRGGDTFLFIVNNKLIKWLKIF